MTIKNLFKEMLLKETDNIANVLSVNITNDTNKDEKLAAILAEIMIGHARDKRLLNPCTALAEKQIRKLKNNDPMSKEKTDAMAIAATHNRIYWNGYQDLPHIDILMNMLYEYGETHEEI